MIFRDEKLNQELNHKGYVVLPVFDPAQIQALREIYSKHKSSSPYFHSTTFSKSIEEKQKMMAEVRGIAAPSLQNLFSDIKPLGASFLTKPVGAGGHMPIHQDWTIVDESKFGSFTIWSPLQDVNEHNGALTVLDGSHKLTLTLRAPTLPVVINGIESLVRNEMKTVALKKGEAIIFNHALIHASHLNQSSEERVALTMGFVPSEAQLLFYHLNDNGTVDQYEVDDDFFLKYDNHGERPTFVKPTRAISADFTPLTAKQFLKFRNEYKAANMKPLFKDPQLQAQLESKGWVVVDFLSDAEVKELKDFYATLNNDHIPSYGFHVSIDNNSSDFVTRVMSKIHETVKGPADKFLQDYKIITSSFAVKEKNPISVIPPHQDWSFTEEDEGFYSINIWTALVDTDMYNGALGVIDESHKFFDHLRASPPPQFKTPLDVHVFSVFPYLKLQPLKAGQALVFDSRTIHASPPNVSDGVRLAVGFVATQKDAPLRHYYLKPGDSKKLMKYEANEYFYTHHSNSKLSQLYTEGKQPEGMTYLGEVENKAGEISDDELVEMIKRAGNTFNVEMCEHLAKLFNYNMDGSKNEEPVAVAEEKIIEEVKEEIVEPVKVVTHETVQPAQQVWVDNRSFFQKYTPLNILREIKGRVLS